MTPDFDTLPQMPTRPDYRLVNGTFMDREEYTVCHWQIVRTFTRDDGSTAAYWAADLEGLRNYGLLKEKRTQERSSDSQGIG